jgi:hypothetical protein
MNESHKPSEIGPCISLPITEANAALCDEILRLHRNSIELPAFDLLVVVQELTRRLEKHAEADDAAYLDRLDEEEVVANIEREELEMLRVRDEIEDGSAPEWLKVFGNMVEGVDNLRTFVVGIRGVGRTLAIDVSQLVDMSHLIEHWLELGSNVQFTMAWLSYRNAVMHEELNSPATVEHSGDANSREGLVMQRKTMRTLMTPMMERSLVGKRSALHPPVRDPST